MRLRTIRIGSVIILGLSAAIGGCAAGAIAYTERGASTQVDASVAESTAAAEAVFEDTGTFEEHGATIAT